MQISISSSVLDRFPDTRIALVQAKQVTNGHMSPLVDDILRDALTTFNRHVSNADLLGHPHIAAWRETYRVFGSNPNKFRPSVEALARRVSKQSALPRVSDVVDIYNAASIAYLLPAGAYDLEAVSGHITLRFAETGELFTPIGVAHPTEKTKEGEVVYSDTGTVLTRHWNYRDCDKTKVTEQSSSILVLCEAAHPAIDTGIVRKCQQYLSETISKVCNGDVRTLWLDADCPEIELSTS